MQYARESWLEERSSWRAIIQLNLIRSIVTLLDLIGDALADSSYDTSPFPLTEKHRLLRLRLAPLRGVQQDLQRRLGAATIEETNNPGLGGVLPRPPEFAVRSRDGWRSALERFRTRPQDAEVNARAADARVRKAAEVTEVVVGCAEDMKALWEDAAVQGMLRRKKIRMEEEPGLYVICFSSSLLSTLSSPPCNFTDERIATAHLISFLNDIERVAARNYEPSDDDVIRARLRTLGVQEYSFWVEQGALAVHFPLQRFRIKAAFSRCIAGHEWLMYDVGGTRSSVSSACISSLPPPSHGGNRLTRC